jgi:hypothetical protein
VVEARALGTGACGGTLNLLAHARQPMLPGSHEGSLGTIPTWILVLLARTDEAAS